ncbi:alkaline-phosphatase-like protein [Pavlovales sp. CCMP2436]|nr:alkaline-phosphatase-like protein [Pavlovales sp. CCMP2436]
MKCATLLIALALAIAPAACSWYSYDAPRPNILILLVDDLGYGDIGAYGNTTIKTPNVDRLAAEGVLLTQHLVASPMCTPSRAALLTGRHAVRLGMSGSKIARVMPSPATPGGISLNEITISSMLKAAGYLTGMVGKWHVGMGENCSHCPLAHGFDSYWGMPVTNVQACGQRPEWFTQALALLFVIFAIFWVPSTIMLLNTKACVLYANNEVIEQPVQLKYLTHRETFHAKEFIESAATTGKPWFLYMSYTKVHTALFVADERAGVSAHGDFGT